MTYLQDQYNEMHPKPKTKEEQFHEWLSECPISITDIQDNSLDGYVGYAVDFEIVDSEAEKVKECIIDVIADSIHWKHQNYHIHVSLNQINHQSYSLKKK